MCKHVLIVCVLTLGLSACEPFPDLPLTDAAAQADEQFPKLLTLPELDEVSQDKGQRQATRALLADARRLRQRARKLSGPVIDQTEQDYLLGWFRS